MPWALCTHRLSNSNCPPCSAWRSHRHRWAHLHRHTHIPLRRRTTRTRWACGRSNGRSTAHSNHKVKICTLSFLRTIVLFVTTLPTTGDALKSDSMTQYQPNMMNYSYGMAAPYSVMPTAPLPVSSAAASLMGAVPNKTAEYYSRKCFFCRHGSPL